VNKEEKTELLKFCLTWPKPLSNEFINAYCEFKDSDSLRNFAKCNGISLARFRKKDDKQ
jgi:hypothetical protein